jgi:L-ascorbate metabolism protein UlaG (beta-lactamase superfamily)
MNNKIVIVLGGVIIALIIILIMNNQNQKMESEKINQEAMQLQMDGEKMMPVEVMPISHATGILKWGSTLVYMDPTGGKEAFDGKPEADIVLITDIHGDHLNVETLEAVLGDATLIVPQAVIAMLPQNLAAKAVVMNNGDKRTEQGIEILAMPMYNLPEADDSRHLKGRGNGYVLEREGYRVYIAGDTAGIPEMRSLTGIDMAFIPMNLPYTMDVEEAASAVLDFQPKKVYPYHYRGPEGLSDINRFKELVNQGGKDIEVVFGDWYPEKAE